MDSLSDARREAALAKAPKAQIVIVDEAALAEAERAVRALLGEPRAPASRHSDEAWLARRRQVFDEKARVYAEAAIAAYLTSGQTPHMIDGLIEFSAAQASIRKVSEAGGDPTSERERLRSAVGALLAMGDQLRQQKSRLRAERRAARKASQVS